MLTPWQGIQRLDSSQSAQYLLLERLSSQDPSPRSIITMLISQHPVIAYLASIFGIIFVGFGFNYIFNPRQAFVSSFDFPYPAATQEQKILDSFCVLFGAKDLFVGVAIYAGAWLGTRKSLGVILLAASLCAAIDGYVVNKTVGHGEWNHWGYGSMIGVLGLSSLGIFG